MEEMVEKKKQVKTKQKLMSTNSLMGYIRSKKNTCIPQTHILTWINPNFIGTRGEENTTTATSTSTILKWLGGLDFDYFYKWRNFI